MTEAEIVRLCELPAGRELDEAVATVLGWAQHPHSWNTTWWHFAVDRAKSGRKRCLAGAIHSWLRARNETQEAALAGKE